MRLLALTLVLAALSAVAAEAYPLRDGEESIEQYAKRAGLPLTKTLDLGWGVMMEFVLIPAGTFTMGTPEPEPVDERDYDFWIAIDQIVFTIGIVVLLGLIAGVLLRTADGRQRLQYSLGLVRSKVRRWVAMGGSCDGPTPDWNFTQNGTGAYLAELLATWPTEAIFSPDGSDIQTGNRLLLPRTPEKNPVREAYRLWDNCLQKGRSSWDQVAALVVVRPQYFTFERQGRSERTEDGKSYWNAKIDNPKHIRARVKTDKAELAGIIEELMAAPPRHKAGAP